MIHTDGKPTIAHRVADAILESENVEKHVMDLGLEDRRELAEALAAAPIPLGSDRFELGPDEKGGD